MKTTATQSRVMDYDRFRPSCDPARRIYDAILDQEKRMQSMRPTERGHALRLRVFREARDYCQEQGQRFPTTTEIQEVEWLALGHKGYAEKFAHGVAELIRKKQEEAE